MNGDERFMRMALDLAREAGRTGEVPVGAVVAVGHQVVGRGHNAPIGRHDPTAHAEVVALRAAGEALGNYRLNGATLYVTVEPCLMCLGAALHARVDRVVFGAADPKLGAADRLTALRRDGVSFNHDFAIEGGLLANDAAGLLLDFFRHRRLPAARDMEGSEASVRSASPGPSAAVSGEVPKWS